MEDRPKWQQAWEALTELAKLDPNGWEVWFEENIPDSATWTKITNRVAARVMKLRETVPTP